MRPESLTLLIIIPVAAGVIIAVFYKIMERLSGAVAILAAALNTWIALLLYNKNIQISIPWAGLGIDLSLRLYNLSSFIVLSLSILYLLITIYSYIFMKGKNYTRQFYAYLLLTLAFATGAILSDNLILLLFFWEGLLLTLFGMIAIGRKGAAKTATKMFVIIGISDLVMLIGIALTANISRTLTISKISIPASGVLGSAAFMFFLIGVLAKSGAMPFHTWIPDAAEDAPLPFMALVPAVLDKLLGIYVLTRICMDMFRIDMHSWLSALLMIIGGLTIVLAVMMALVQKDYKKLLSYHAISQVGYMILGIGTCLPIGIVGGLFHMVNNALYKSCLFLTGGAVEKEAGTTDIEKLGGLRSKMPITCACFVITALSISGVPPFNGFFSKELVYDAALERGWVYYALAVLGSFFTAASFLKLGHAVYFGKVSQKNESVKETNIVMLAPMAAIALACVAFGVFSAFLTNKVFAPMVNAGLMSGHHFAGVKPNAALIAITVIVLCLAFANHWFGFKKTGSASKAEDHIHYAPILAQTYSLAEKRFFDPYDIGLKIISLFSYILWWFDRVVDSIYEIVIVRASLAISNGFRAFQSGYYTVYIAWAVIGFICIVIYSFYKLGGV